LGFSPLDRGAWQALPMARPHLESAEEKNRNHDAATVIPLRSESPEEQEWSEIGRRSDFPAGWYVIPAFLLTLILIAAAIYLIT
jgi:hypothetical protein